jgi:hypothetical protein
MSPGSAEDFRIPDRIYLPRIIELNLPLFDGGGACIGDGH